MGPNKDYTGLYGDAKCRDCKWLGVSVKIKDRARCFIPTNIKQHWTGTCYLETPSGKNHLGRCPDFEKIICTEQDSD